MVRMRFPVALLSVIIACGSAQAQWQIQNSRTTASLRGIHALSSEVAWASGTSGTVLRTTNGGTTWLPCTTPPNAEKLDFSGIQAFDQNTAIVMSSGKGDLSRLYKTTDACKTWKLVFTNPDKDGFWDAMQFVMAPRTKTVQCFGALVGDPVESNFPMFLSFDCGDKWERQTKAFPTALAGESLFAASNSSLILNGLNRRGFVTGGPSGARVLKYLVEADDTRGPEDYDAKVARDAEKFTYVPRHMQADVLPWIIRSTTSGAFSIGSRPVDEKSYLTHEVVVGGDYSTPERIGAAAYGFIGGSTDWHTAQTPPHGYRSSVAFNPTQKFWITVGPNGTDISHDDGKNWTPLKPSPQDSPDADKNWNALSLPFVVGPHGRIGKLNSKTLVP